MPTIRINASVSSGQTPRALGLGLQWSKKAAASVKEILGRYPVERSRSAVIPLLWLAQREFGGWLSVDAMQLVADTLELPYIRVYEVASFYTMFNLKPVGKFHVQVCTNCSCMIRGSDAIVAAVKDVTGIEASGENSADGMFTFTEVECLGACVAAPMMQVTLADGPLHYYTHLDAGKVREILGHLKKGGEAATFADTSPAKHDPICGGYGG
ncbi:MAG: NAD(P)H-dependent oxidoreductase subunit E [Proteobacteria bacterium]|nr:NAD(P)H-dependent oxidoreductase subunit E [Pseudomonadota bacterium]